MTGRASREKGKRGERQLATILRLAMPELAEHVRRGWQSRVGCDDPDVCLPGLWLEHKCGAKPNMRAAYAQARRDCSGRGAVPVAVIQDDRARERLCVLGLTDFLRILRAAYGHTEPLKYGVQGELFDEVAE